MPVRDEEDFNEGRRRGDVEEKDHRGVQRDFKHTLKAIWWNILAAPHSFPITLGSPPPQVLPPEGLGSLNERSECGRGEGR